MTWTARPAPRRRRRRRPTGSPDSGPARRASRPRARRTPGRAGSGPRRTPARPRAPRASTARSRPGLEGSDHFAMVRHRLARYPRTSDGQRARPRDLAVPPPARDNPVDWRPWGPEALAEARERDVAAAVSIGYSACHWCHVMEHESFEDAETAALMNEHFVNIKVDREERPDVDALYMEAVQAMTGQGGWPMTVFLTPDGRPFYGGTYFPPAPRDGHPGLPAVLEGVRRRVGGGAPRSSGRRRRRAARRRGARRAAEPVMAEALRRRGRDRLRGLRRACGGFGGRPSSRASLSSSSCSPRPTSAQMRGRRASRKMAARRHLRPARRRLPATRSTRVGPSPIREDALRQLAARRAPTWRLQVPATAAAPTSPRRRWTGAREMLGRGGFYERRRRHRGRGGPSTSGRPRSSRVSPSWPSEPVRGAPDPGRRRPARDAQAACWRSARRACGRAPTTSG